MAVITKKTIIKPGEPFIVPPNAEIIYVSDSNSLESDCLTIPATGPLICYTYSWSVEFDGGGGSAPWSYQYTVLSKFVIEGVQEYDFSARTVDGRVGLWPTGNSINTATPENVNLINFTLYQTLNQDAEFPGQVVSLKYKGGFGETDYMQLILKLPEVIGKNSYLEFDGPGFDSQNTTSEGAIKIFAHRCDECCGDVLPEG